MVRKCTIDKVKSSLSLRQELSISQNSFKNVTFKHMLSSSKTMYAIPGQGIFFCTIGFY